MKDQESNIVKAVEILREKEIIIYPTDTVYGLGALPEKESVDKIYEVKKRDNDKSLIALVSSKEEVEKYAEISNKEIYDILANTFWPGALTLILKSKGVLPDILISKDKTIGFRIPDNEVALDLIKKSGGLIFTTSANISGEKSPVSVEDISDELKKKVKFILDDGRTTKEEVSTIISLVNGVDIIREGAIKKKTILELVRK